MGVLDGAGDRQRGRNSFGINVRHPIVSNGILCVRGGDAAFLKLLWDLREVAVTSLGFLVIMSVNFYLAARFEPPPLF